MTLTACEINGQVYVDVIKSIDFSPLERAMKQLTLLFAGLEMLGYDPSGLDEFHPDTTHNPTPPVGRDGG